MKNTLAIIFTFASFVLYGQKSKDIIFEEVREDGLKSYINIKEPVKSLRTGGGLLIEIEPIDASSLNDSFYENSKYSGKYDYTFYTSRVEDHFIDLKKRKRRYLKSENEFLYEGLYYLLDNDEIEITTYEQLVFEVSLGTAEAEEQELADIFTSHNKHNFNPYYLSVNRYLNVFKITVKNPDSNPVKNELEMNVYNGGENLHFLSNEEIRDYYIFDGKIKDQNLMRSNIAEHPIFPGNSTTVGYFATLPLNLTDDQIQVMISDPGSTSSISWSAEINRDIISNVKKFYEIKVKPSSSTFRSYYVIEPQGEASIYIVGNDLYIHEGDIDKQVVIHYYGMRTRKLFYGKSDPIRLSEFLDFQKMKRDKLKINADKLSEVERSGKSDSK